MSAALALFAFMGTSECLVRLGPAGRFVPSPGAWVVSRLGELGHFLVDGHDPAARGGQSGATGVYSPLGKRRVPGSWRHWVAVGSGSPGTPSVAGWLQALPQVSGTAPCSCLKGCFLIFASSLPLFGDKHFLLCPGTRCLHLFPQPHWASLAWTAPLYRQTDRRDPHREMRLPRGGPWCS